MLKRHRGSLTFFISISVFIHLVIVYLLVSMKTTLPEIKAPKKVTAIKSYLYRAPKKIEKVKKTQVKAKTETVKPKAATETKPVTKKSAQVKPANVELPDDLSSAIKPHPKDKPKSKPKLKPKLKLKPRLMYSVNTQLNKIKNRIDKQILNKEMQQYRANQSGSAADSVIHKGHGFQIPVPHTVVPLTEEQKREKNTIKMDDSISLIKGDDGNCQIIRERFPGSPVMGSSSMFNCGKTKMEKSFTAHMKKVRAKIMPIK